MNNWYDMTFTYENAKINEKIYSKEVHLNSVPLTVFFSGLYSIVLRDILAPTVECLCNGSRRR